ncbi:WD40-repeat-containing domain protein [Limtongia smithiae]|uniref:WD40-repeat-containing domain protein n=1 Tax=Limtongia smithiae TaxID=1125753 RepID=UPI0034CE82B2
MRRFKVEAVLHTSAVSIFYYVVFCPFVKRNGPQIFATIGDNYVIICACGLDSVDDQKVKILATYTDANVKESLCSAAFIADPATGAPWLAVGGKSGVIKVLDCHTGALVRQLAGHGDEILDLQACPTVDHVIASTSGDHTIRLWNLEERYIEQPCAVICAGEGHREQVLTVSFHDSGRFIVSGGMDNQVHLWALPDLATLEIPKDDPIVLHWSHFQTNALHSNYVDCVSFYGDLLLSKAAKESKIVLWQIDGFSSSLAPYLGQSNAPTNHDRTKDTLSAFGKGFTRLAQFSIPSTAPWYMRFGMGYSRSDGPALAMGNDNGRIYVFELRDLELASTASDSQHLLSESISVSSEEEDDDGAENQDYEIREGNSFSIGTVTKELSGKAEPILKAEFEESSKCESPTEQVYSFTGSADGDEEDDEDEDDEDEDDEDEDEEPGSHGVSLAETSSMTAPAKKRRTRKKLTYSWKQRRKRRSAYAKSVVKLLASGKAASTEAVSSTEEVAVEETAEFASNEENNDKRFPKINDDANMPNAPEATALVANESQILSSVRDSISPSQVSSRTGSVIIALSDDEDYAQVAPSVKNDEVNDSTDDDKDGSDSLLTFGHATQPDTFSVIVISDEDGSDDGFGTGLAAKRIKTSFGSEIPKSRVSKAEFGVASNGEPNNDEEMEDPGNGDSEEGYVEDQDDTKVDNITTVPASKSATWTMKSSPPPLQPPPLVPLPLTEHRIIKPTLPAVTGTKRKLSLTEAAQANDASSTPAGESATGTPATESAITKTTGNTVMPQISGHRYEEPSTVLSSVALQQLIAMRAQENYVKPRGTADARPLHAQSDDSDSDDDNSNEMDVDLGDVSSKHQPQSPISSDSSIPLATAAAAAAAVGSSAHESPQPQWSTDGTSAIADPFVFIRPHTVLEIPRSRRLVRHLTFSPHGDYLVAVGDNGVICVWQVLSK